MPPRRRTTPLSPRRKADRLARPGQQFFTITPDWRGLTPESLAKAFVNYYVTSGLLERPNAATIGADGLFHLSIASDQESLEILTKRGPLVADRLLLSHAKIDRGNVVDESVEDPRRTKGWWWQRDLVPLEQTETVYAHGADLTALGTYLRDVEPLISQGQLTYIPRVTRQKVVRDYLDETLGLWPDPGHEETADLVPELLVSSGRVVEVVQNAYKARLLNPALTLELPYLEGTTLRDYCEIMVQESNALGILQDHLRPKLLEITASPDTDEFHARIAALSSEISEGVRAVASELKVTARRSAVQVTGGGLAVCTAALLAVEAEALAAVVSTIGATGGIWGLVTALQQSSEWRVKARTQPYYFLWVIDKHSQRS